MRPLSVAIIENLQLHSQNAGEQLILQQSIKSLLDYHYKDLQELNDAEKEALIGESIHGIPVSNKFRVIKMYHDRTNVDLFGAKYMVNVKSKNCLLGVTLPQQEHRDGK